MFFQPINCEPDSTASVFVKTAGLLLKPIECDPVSKSSAQDEINKSKLELSSFTVFNKAGDCEVPANLGIRFYNCDFNKFKAIEGGNVFYFENCTFQEGFEMNKAEFIMAGCKLRQGGTMVETKGELVPILKENPLYNSGAVAPEEEPALVPGEEGVGTANPWDMNTVYPCIVNNTMYCSEYSSLDSEGSIWEWAQSIVELLDDISDKAMLMLSAFSSFTCYLDRFLNIPFQIISLIDGCIAKFTAAIFSKIDKLLAPIFSALKSITAIISAVQGLIATVKNIADRIATILKGSIVKIISTPFIIAARTAFVLDIKSRLECQLVGRLMAINGSVLNIKNQSKAVVKGCESIIGCGDQPTIWQQFGGIAELSNTTFLQSQRNMVCSIQTAGVLKLFNVGTVQTSGVFPAIQSTMPKELLGVGTQPSIWAIGSGLISSNGGPAVSCVNSDATFTNCGTLTSGGQTPAVVNDGSNSLFKNVEHIVGSILANASSIVVSDSKDISAVGVPAITLTDGSTMTISSTTNVGTTGGSACVVTDSDLTFNEVGSVVSSGGPALSLFNANITAKNTIFSGLNDGVVAS